MMRIVGKYGSKFVSYFAPDCILAINIIGGILHEGGEVAYIIVEGV